MLLAGVELLEPLFDAIQQHTVLRIQYRLFEHEPIQKTIHPWWLKQSNSRWFLFGWDEDKQRLDNSPLDRIEKISPLQLAYRINDTLNPIEYFSPILGVTRRDQDEVSQLVIRVREARANYLISKPLHISQQAEPAANGWKQFSYQLMINKEFIAQLLWFGADLEVLSPEILRKEISSALRAATALYGQAG